MFSWILSCIPWWVWLVIILIIVIVIYWNIRSRGADIKSQLERSISNAFNLMREEGLICSPYEPSQPQEEVNPCYNIDGSEKPKCDVITTCVPYEVLMAPPDKNIPKTSEYNGQKFASWGEAIMAYSLEKTFSCNFRTVRPGFLRNPETNRNLELDCYSEDAGKRWGYRGIAGEYMGIQHYQWPNWTSQTKDQFISQARRDKFKHRRCDEEGVYLITVPYFVPYDKIPAFVEYYAPHNTMARLGISGG